MFPVRLENSFSNLIPTRQLGARHGWVGAIRSRGGLQEVQDTSYLSGFRGNCLKPTSFSPKGANKQNKCCQKVTSTNRDIFWWERIVLIRNPSRASSASNFVIPKALADWYQKHLNGYAAPQRQRTSLTSCSAPKESPTGILSVLGLQYY